VIYIHQQQQFEHEACLSFYKIFNQTKMSTVRPLLARSLRQTVVLCNTTLHTAPNVGLQAVARRTFAASASDPTV
jgi:hypothetical protein